jgi:hypothetical protein
MSDVGSGRSSLEEDMERLDGFRELYDDPGWCIEFEDEVPKSKAD